MIKKRFLSMLVLLMAVVTGAWATTVTWVTTDFYNISPDTFTKYDVTVTTTNQARMSNYFYGNGVNTFTTTLGNFTKIEIVFMPESSPVSATGWNYEVIESVQPFPEDMPEIVEYTSKLTWTGDAESVSIQGLVMNIKSITFTIAEPANGYTVSMKESTEDATSWQGKAGDGTYQQLPLEGVAQGAQVGLKYGGALKVKSVKAKKKAAPATARALAEATAEDLGKVVGADGKIYADVAAAKAASTTACAIIAYVGSGTDHATYTHGLAIALADESNSNWSTAKSTCEGKSAVTDAAWLLPSQNQWKAMFSANGGNEGQYTGLNTAITTAGGTALQGTPPYWSSTPTGDDDGTAYNVLLGGGGAEWYYDYYEESGYRVRACLAF